MSDYIGKEELKERLVYCRGIGRTSLEAVLKAMDNTPTVDEKEIIRKTVDRIVDKVKEASFPRNLGNVNELVVLKDRLIDICKEEGGIE